MILLGVNVSFSTITSVFFILAIGFTRIQALSNPICHNPVLPCALIRSNPIYFPILGKEKSPNFFEIQGFTSFSFLKSGATRKRTYAVSLLTVNLLYFLKFGIPHDLAHDYFSSFCSLLA